MFLNESSIKEAIVHTLSRDGALSADEIHLSLVRKHKPCTLQAVYKELKALLSNGVVLKVKSRYGLSISWTVKVLEFGDLVSKTCLENRLGLFEIPREGEKSSWRFPSIVSSDQFWMQIVLQLIRNCTSKRMFQWIPHPWHRLYYGKRSSEFEEALRYVGARDYIIVGGETYLDVNIRRSWPQDVFTSASTPGPFDSERKNYLTLVDDFIVRTEYEEKLVRNIETYYDKVKNSRDVHSDEVLQLFQLRTKVKVLLERNERKASVLTKKFIRYFGLVGSKREFFS